MENRRPTSIVKPFSPRKYYDKSKPNTSGGYDKYQSNAGDNRAPNRENNDRFQTRDTRGKYEPRDGGSNAQQRDGRPNIERPRTDRPNPGRPNNEGRNFRDNGDFRPNRNSQTGPGKFLSRSNNNNKFNPKNRTPLNGKTEKPWQRENNIKIVSDLQVTDGKHKGKYLKNSTSAKTVPTARKIRDIMFKILFRRVRAGRFLDLCAGAGTMGIEAISRGAIVSTFVERSAKMCGFIKKNLAELGIKEGHGEVSELEVLPFLKKMAKRKRVWDVIYLDPPPNSDYDEILTYLKRGTALKPSGVLVIQHPAELFFPENLGVLKRWRVVAQDETALSFYERK
ncbi:MAG: methyltransferase, RsmD family [Acidobacteria bacterium]|jgi:16S rRNA (guanine966-N2)-methyltransferase|nr:methyltransferase, RsmD family [Acidobacteriota bacterium]